MYTGQFCKFPKPRAIEEILYDYVLFSSINVECIFSF